MTAVAEKPALPYAPPVPLWIKDVRWEDWHAWPVENQMGRDGEARTACGWVWTWSDTIQTSYHVSGLAGCFICRLWLEGEYVPRQRGRPHRLPPGPEPAKKKPGRKPKLADLNAPSRTWVEGQRGRPPKAVSEARKAEREAKEAEAERELAELRADDAAWENYTFEVGGRIRTWSCQECGQVLIEPGRWCTRLCEQTWLMGEQHDRWERDGLAIARRQFHERLYGIKRRDSIRSLTPPRARLRSLLTP